MLSCLAAVVAAGVTASGCASSAGAPAGGQARGTADVAYAGSLAYLNEQVVGPAFARATGYSYQGRGAGSDALSAEIASGQISPGAFISVGADPIAALMPKFTRWYIRYATTSIVLAYNPASRYAAKFEAIARGRLPMSDLFRLMQQPGFQLGRTDPNTDPQGRAFVYMLELAQARYHLPAGTVTKILGGRPASAGSPQVFEETALDARLQAGQIDAASAYLSQAIQLHLHYIVLPAGINLGDPAFAGVYKKASITIAGNVTKHGSPLALDITTIGKPSQKAASAFVSFVLSKAGRALYAKGGYTLLAPAAFGDVADIPAAIRRELGG